MKGLRLWLPNIGFPTKSAHEQPKKLLPKTKLSRNVVIIYVQMVSVGNHAEAFRPYFFDTYVWPAWGKLRLLELGFG